MPADATDPYAEGKKAGLLKAAVFLEMFANQNESEHAGLAHVFRSAAKICVEMAEAALAQGGDKHGR